MFYYFTILLSVLPEVSCLVSMGEMLSIEVKWPIYNHDITILSNQLDIVLWTNFSQLCIYLLWSCKPWISV